MFVIFLYGITNKDIKLQELMSNTNNINNPPLDFMSSNSNYTIQ